MCCDELGAPYRPERLTEWFGRHRRAAGISTGTLHILSTYAHLLPQSDELAAERVAAAIG